MVMEKRSLFHFFTFKSVATLTTFIFFYQIVSIILYIIYGNEETVNLLSRLFESFCITYIILFCVAKLSMLI